MSDPAPLRGVLLDVDGTLVDSNDAHARSWVDALAEFGYDVAYDEVRRRIGEGGDKLIPQVTGLQSETERARRLSTRRWEIFRDVYLPRLRATRGARELVDRLRDDGLRLVVATSGKEDEVRAILSQVGLADVLPERTSSDDAERSKPDPDIVHAALDRESLRPAEAIMLGDTPYDVQAGMHAGVHVIALRSGGWVDAELRGAVAIFDDPAALLREWESSPLGERGAR